jgi:hypothetical protein
VIVSNSNIGFKASSFASTQKAVVEKRCKLSQNKSVDLNGMWRGVSNLSTADCVQLDNKEIAAVVWHDQHVNLH